MTDKNNKTIEYRFVSYTGKIWTDCQVDTYNALTRRIESFGDNPPEYLLNGRHKLFVAFNTPVVKEG